jgi:hypothetical protein
MVQPLDISPCSIDYPGDELPSIDHGRLSFFGARCGVWEWDVDRGAYSKIDTISNFTPEGPERGTGRVTVSGRSTLFAETVGVSDADAVVKLTATPVPANV